MTLETLLENLNIPLPKEFRSLSVSGVACHSKQVKPGDLFVAVKGADADGAAYIPEALKHGAKVIVSERDFPSDPKTVKVIVPDARKVLAWVCHRFYETPSETLTVIGITGTNGKTTVAHLVESLLKEAGFGVGLIGTIAHRVGDREIPAQNTTPGALEIQSLLSQMVHAASHYAVMEVSSHALDQQRVTSVKFQTAVFTNLTHDHLDYHHTEEAYFQAKRRLFASLDKEATSILNADSPYCGRIKEATRANCLTYGFQKKADLSLDSSSFKKHAESVSFDCFTPGGTLHITSHLIGNHNLYNVLAAVGVGLSQGIPLETIQEGIAHVTSVAGRLEKIEAGQSYAVYVDYAHTEDALRVVLLSLREFTPGRLLVVFGCGGDRDRTKRPRMAEVVARSSDWAVVTSDNPRSEDPKKILKEVETGFPGSFNYHLEEDRARAIESALLEAKRGDTVLIAGKGHETTQVFKDQTIDFDDRKIAYDILSHSRDTQSDKRILSSGRG